MMIKLQDKTIPELKALLLDVERAIKLIEREKRQREAAARRRSSQADEKPKNRKKVDSSSTMLPTPPKVKARSEDVQPAPQPGPKYMHPASRQMVWDGEGEHPDWLKAYLERGGSWGALENTAQIFNERRTAATAARAPAGPTVVQWTAEQGVG
jgi:DNA-binding protein H-NS